MQAPEPPNLGSRTLESDIGIQPRTIIMVGASVRAAAQSARRAGFTVIGIDQFGDWDARNACDEFVDLEDREGVDAALSRHPDALVVPVGGISDLERWLDRHPQAARRWVISAETRQSIDDPLMLSSLAGRAGMSFPETLDASGRIIRTVSPQRWLSKPKHGSGGIGIRWHTGGTLPDRTDPQSRWLQHWIPGRSFGATLWIGPRRTVLLGVCRSMFHRMTTQSSAKNLFANNPFVYSGSFGPIDCQPSVVDPLLALSRHLSSECGYQGPCNVDFLIDPMGTLWLLEINPRWSGSTELVERRMIDDGVLGADDSLIQWWLDDTTAHVAVSPRRRKQGESDAYYKKVCFARRRLLFQRERIASVVDCNLQIADIPVDGSVVPRGTPICSVIAKGRPSDPDFYRRVRRAHHQLCCETRFPK
ncbi:ATP-grasp domain protein [Rubripirellula tenax]|uniref:ATP-grasp domain protein n=1 Tax=Rubripirellula tenax TaxID=2528015 RepID=A0A5C6F8Z4_9BACT|nr:ATP-grasp domain-containing protein [Rubripirellula tenax]TWU56606.1 ATP-grasp domain protein [Rubripirellula tenax]